jgi:hypothetical protein
MAYTAANARQQILDVLADAADDIGLALADLGEAYELLDDHAAERLEEQLFGPVQLAYGRAKRTHAEFARRYELPTHAFVAQAAGGGPSTGAKGFIERSVEAASKADGTLATLQDSMLPVEVGDPELRAGITAVRELLGGVRGQAREIVRVFGR